MSVYPTIPQDQLTLFARRLCPEEEVQKAFSSAQVTFETIKDAMQIDIYHYTPTGTDSFYHPYTPLLESSTLCLRDRDMRILLGSIEGKLKVANHSLDLYSGRMRRGPYSDATYALFCKKVKPVDGDGCCVIS